MAEALDYKPLTIRESCNPMCRAIFLVMAAIIAAFGVISGYGELVEMVYSGTTSG